MLTGETAVKSVSIHLLDAVTGAELGAWTTWSWRFHCRNRIGPMTLVDPNGDTTSVAADL